MEEKQKFLALRVPPDLKLALKRAAKADRRSVASFVVKVLEDHLSDDGWLPAGGFERGKGDADA